MILTLIFQSPNKMHKISLRACLEDPKQIANLSAARLRLLADGWTYKTGILTGVDGVQESKQVHKGASS